MRAECCGDGKRSRAVVGSSLGVVLGLAAALLPKCPLCVAAYLSMLGVGTAVSHAVAPLLFPIGIALTALCLALLIVLVVRR
jgi:hypothetical protein